MTAASAAHIAIDASRTTVRQRTGTENYALQIIRHVLALDAAHSGKAHFHLYFRDTPPPDLFPPGENWTPHVIPFRRAWTHLRFAAEIARTRPALTWVPAHTLPFIFPGRAVVTLHDVGYKHFPQAHPDSERRYLDWTTRYSAARARLILTDSEATRRDLGRFYGVSPEKVRVVYPGVDESIRRVEDPQQLTRVREKYGLPPRYLLFVGTLQPRKNIGRLVEAFRLWQAQSAHQEVALALGGKPGWLYDPAWAEGVPNVHILGYVADEDLSALYSGALGLVLPSLFEGFGFPVVEAMRCGIPVLCSETSSLPELAGAAGILVNPLNVESIAAGIAELVENPATRERLIMAGREQVKKFTWEQAAQDAFAVLMEALS